MKHIWKITYGTWNGGFIQEKIRICEICEQEQVWITHYEWGRVKGYSWYPLISRCGYVPPQTTPGVY